MWPVAIVAVLAITVGANFALLWKAGDPTATAIEPDYYRKAVKWDSTMAQARADVALGWHSQAEFGPLGPGGAALAVTLTDSAAVPVAGVALHVEAINNVDATRHLSADLVEAAPGRYEGRLPLPRPGLWEVRVTARRGAELFTESLRLDAAQGTAR